MEKEKLEFPKVKYQFGGYLDDYLIKRVADWEDLGFVDTDDKHDFCGRELKIGRENGKLFKWCPRCEIKVLAPLSA